MSKFVRLARVAAAAGLLLAGAAQAQSSVNLYGLVDLSAGSFQTAGGPSVKRLDSGNMSTSYWGIKGTEDLGGGVRANFQLEGFLNADTGTAGRVAGVDAFWARNANVSLSGGFGTVKPGRQAPPLFVSTLLFNAFGDSFGYSPAIRQYYSAPYGTPLVGDSGWNNAIGYSLPSYGGLSANVVIAAGEGAATAKGKNFGANVLYFSGPFAATVAWQDVKAQGVLGRAISAFPGFQNQTTYQAGGSFDAGLLKVYAQYGKVNTYATKNVITTNANAGVKVPFGAGAFLAQYGRSVVQTDGVSLDTKSQIGTVGYDYFLSKRTDVYAIVMGEKLTGVKKGMTYAVGVKHTF